MRIPSLSGFLASHDEIAEPRYHDRRPLGELLLHDLEDGFHDSGGVSLGKSELVGDVLNDVQLGHGHGIPPPFPDYRFTLPYPSMINP